MSMRMTASERFRVEVRVGGELRPAGDRVRLDAVVALRRERLGEAVLDEVGRRGNRLLRGVDRIPELERDRPPVGERAILARRVDEVGDGRADGRGTRGSEELGASEQEGDRCEGHVRGEKPQPDGLLQRLPIREQGEEVPTRDGKCPHDVTNRARWLGPRRDCKLDNRAGQKAPEGVGEKVESRLHVMSLPFPCGRSSERA